MRHEYELDPTSFLYLATSGTDAYVTIPVDPPDSLMSNPRDTGSLWFISVDAEPVAINVNATAVWGTNAFLEIGSYLTHPLRLPPGFTVHFVTKTGAGSVSLIRARRAS